MSAGKGDKPRPVNKTRYDMNFTAINWKSSSSGKIAEDCTGNRITTASSDADKGPPPDTSTPKS